MRPLAESPRTRRALAAASTTLLAGAVLATSPRPGEGADPWREYWQALAQGAAGGPQAVETALGALTPRDHERVLARVASLRKKAAKCAACEAKSELQSLPLEDAALFHTRRAWARPGPGDRDEIHAAFTFAEARGILPEGGAFARGWLRAVILKAHAAADGTLALEYASHAERLYPGDGELLLAAGTLHEALAGFASLAPPSALDAVAKSRLQEAERLFSGVGEGPALEEARLRLGRVRLLLGQGGLREIEESALRAASPRIACLAQLFLGRAREQANRFAEAERAYRAAQDACPEAQTPRLARAAVLWRSQRAAEARAEAEAALALAADRRRRDPFAAYPWGRSDEADVLLAGLRPSP